MDRDAQDASVGMPRKESDADCSTATPQAELTTSAECDTDTPPSSSPVAPPNPFRKHRVGASRGVPGQAGDIWDPDGPTRSVGGSREGLLNAMDSKSQVTTSIALPGQDSSASKQGNGQHWSLLTTDPAFLLEGVLFMAAVRSRLGPQVGPEGMCHTTAAAGHRCSNPLD